MILILLHRLYYGEFLQWKRSNTTKIPSALAFSEAYPWLLSCSWFCFFRDLRFISEAFFSTGGKKCSAAAQLYFRTVSILSGCHGKLFQNYSVWWHCTGIYERLSCRKVFFQCNNQCQTAYPTDHTVYTVHPFCKSVFRSGTSSGIYRAGLKSDEPQWSGSFSCLAGWYETTPKRQT